MHRLVVLHVAETKLCGRIDPFGLAILVSLRFEVIKDSNDPALAYEQIDDVRANETGASGNECTLLMHSHSPSPKTGAERYQRSYVRPENEVAERSSTARMRIPVFTDAMQVA